jgi:hypothetical protein
MSVQRRSPVQLGICYPEMLGNLSFFEARMSENGRFISENPGEFPRELRLGNAFSRPRPLLGGGNSGNFRPQRPRIPRAGFSGDILNLGLSQSILGSASRTCCGIPIKIEIK